MFSRSLRRYVLLSVLLLSAARAPAAEKLFSLKLTHLPPLPVENASLRLAIVNDRPLAFDAGSAWLFDNDTLAWTKLAHSPLTPASIIAASGRDLLVFQDGTASVQRLTLSDQGVFLATPLAALPAALTHASATALNGTLYVCGAAAGQNAFYSLDLTAAGAGWQTLPPWPGAPAGRTALATQNDGVEDALYLTAQADGAISLYRYATRQGGWSSRTAPRFAVLPGTVLPVGQSHLLFVARAAHAGDGLRVVGYDTITDEWAQFGAWTPNLRPETLVGWRHGFIAAETPSAHAAGVTPLASAQLQMDKRLLQPLDYAVIGLYFLVVASIGWYCYRTGKKDTTSFFVAGRKIPWWAAGLSLYATGTSAISYLAIPAKSYATNWLYLSQVVVGFFGTIYVAIVIVPLIRRLNVVSVYEYLEMRFHPSVRVFSSVLCIISHICGRMGVVMFLPALALSTVTGINVTTSILVMGVITTIYTVLGGMKAVIWTDVLQVFVMLGGALFAIGYVIFGIHGGPREFFHIAIANHKMRLFDWHFDFTAPTVWVMILIAIFGTLTWPQDQVMMQRVLSTSDDKAAGRSIWTLAIIVIPGSFLFYAIGTALYAFYKSQPGTMNPLLDVDATFPHFIASQLPPGITGMIIAGIFASSMATLSSNMNSVATLVSVDIYERLFKRSTEKTSMLLAEIITVIAGILGTLMALLLSRFNLPSLFDTFLMLMALLGGGFAGIYALGMFTRRSTWQGAIIGIIASIFVTLWFKLNTPVHVLMLGPIAIASCMAFGYVTSFFFPPPARSSLLGLTIFDRRPKSVPAPASS